MRVKNCEVTYFSERDKYKYVLGARVNRSFVFTYVLLRARCVHLCSCSGFVLTMKEYGMKLSPMRLILIFTVFSSTAIVKGKCPIVTDGLRTIFDKSSIIGASMKFADSVGRNERIKRSRRDISKFEI